MTRSLVLFVTIAGIVLGRPEVHSHTSLHHGGHAVTHHGGQAIAHHGGHAVTHHGGHAIARHRGHAVSHHGSHAVTHHGGRYATHHHPVLHHSIPNHGSSYHHDAHAPAHYAFDYAVLDDYSGNHFGHTESRDGYNTKGSYFVHLPDGRIQTVSYYADQYGYNPTVSYTGIAHHPVHHAPAYHVPATAYH